MKRSLSLLFTLFLFLLLTSEFIIAQTQTVWANRTGGSSNIDRASIVQTDNVGNIYVVGNIVGTVDLDPGNGVINHTTEGNSGSSDIYVQKLDANGNLIWTGAFGGFQHDFIGGVVVDSLGNCYISGSFTDTPDFDIGNGVHEVTAVGQRNGFLLKLDAIGIFQWVKTFEGPNTRPTGLAIDDSLNLYISGYFDNICDFDPGPGTVNLTASLLDPFLIKLNSAGDYVWAKHFQGGGNDYGYSVALDDQANVFMTGAFSDMTDFDPGVLDAWKSSNGERDAFVIKLDRDGNYLWSATIGSIYDDFMGDLEITSDGGVVILGKFRYYVDFDPGPGSNIINSYGGHNIFIEKLNSQGYFEWVKILNSGWYANSIDIDENDRSYIAGSYRGTLDFDPGPDTNSVSSAGNSEDIYVLNLDDNGDFLWVQSIGGTQDDEGTGLTLDPHGSLILCGNFEGTVDFDTGAGTVQLGSIGYADGFVIKMDGATSIQEMNQAQLLIYPNPSSGVFMVDLSDWTGEVETKVYAINGSLISSYQLEAGVSQTISLNAPTGVYILEVTGDQGTIRSRLVIR